MPSSNRALMRLALHNLPMEILSSVKDFLETMDMTQEYHDTLSLALELLEEVKAGTITIIHENDLEASAPPLPELDHKRMISNMQSGNGGEWGVLPLEIHDIILGYLGLPCQYVAINTCKLWRHTIRNLLNRIEYSATGHDCPWGFCTCDSPKKRGSLSYSIHSMLGPSATRFGFKQQGSEQLLFIRGVGWELVGEAVMKGPWWTRPMAKRIKDDGSSEGVGYIQLLFYFANDPNVEVYEVLDALGCDFLTLGDLFDGWRHFLSKPELNVPREASCLVQKSWDTYELAN